MAHYGPPWTLEEALSAIQGAGLLPQLAKLLSCKALELSVAGVPSQVAHKHFEQFEEIIEIAEDIEGAQRGRSFIGCAGKAQLASPLATGRGRGPGTLELTPTSG